MVHTEKDINIEANIKKTLLSTTFSVSVALLSMLACSAVQAQTLILGSHIVTMNFTKDGGVTQGNEGGGSINSSSLNGVALPFVYCVDINHTITVPGTYTPTPITTNGTVFGSALNNAG